MSYRHVVVKLIEYFQLDTGQIDVLTRVITRIVVVHNTAPTLYNMMLLLNKESLAGKSRCVHITFYAQNR